MAEIEYLFNATPNKKKFINNMVKLLKKEELHIINSSFDYFKKDIKKYEKTKGIETGKKLMNNDEQKALLNTLKKNLNGTIIFSLPYEEKDIKLKNNFLPFDRFYIASTTNIICYDEIYTCNGYYVLDYNEDCFVVIYFWSKSIGDGWHLESSMINKNSFSVSNKQFISNVIHPELISGERKDILEEFNRRFHILIKNLIYKVEKKEYTSYKKWSPNGYEKKEIIYIQDVMTHRRHFWKDSGRFKIPFMSKEELREKGYGLYEVAFRNGELRRDVPYLIINEFVKGEMKKRKEENKEIKLYSRRILRQEEKVYKVLREIYPNKIIRRHDRKTLKGLELDFNIPELRMGIEYDGEQHFDRNLYEKLYGKGFNEQIKRDKLKNRLCIKRDIKLIRIKYNEPITKSHFKKIGIY